MDTYFYDIVNHFNPRSRFVKSTLKRCPFVDFPGIEFWKWMDVDTHLSDKHEHVFLRDFELFWPALKVGQTKS